MVFAARSPASSRIGSSGARNDVSAAISIIDPTSCGRRKTPNCTAMLWPYARTTSEVLDRVKSAYPCTHDPRYLTALNVEVCVAG